MAGRLAVEVRGADFRAARDWKVVRERILLASVVVLVAAVLGLVQVAAEVWEVVADSAVDAFQAVAADFRVAVVQARVVPAGRDADRSSVVAEVPKDARPCSGIVRAADSRVCAVR